MALSLRPLEPFGAEIDLDLGRGIDDATAGAIREAFVEHRLLLFRGHRVPRDQQEALARLFGRVPQPGSDLRIVSNRGGEATLGTSELLFHGDMDFAPDSYNAVSLHAVRVENGKTSTRFVDGVMLWERIPEDLRRRIEGLQVRIAYVGDYSRRDPRSPLDPRIPQHVYSLPRIHPATGRKVLFVSVAGIRGIVGMEAAAGEALLAEIFDYCFDPQNVYEHFWHVNDLIIWDNLALMHARGALTTDKERTLQKVSALERTLQEQFPPGEGWLEIGKTFDPRQLGREIKAQRARQPSPAGT